MAPETIAAASLSRMKKLAQAEFALQPDGVITLDGISFTGNDVLQELDQADAQQRLHYHLLLWEHKELLELLEKDHLHMDNMGQWYALHRDEGFRDFVSPYFATAFHSAMNTLLHNQDLYSAASWMDFLVFVRPEDEEQAIRSVRVFLEEALRLFRNLNDKSYRDRLPELAPWRDSSWSLLINKLPSSLMPYTDELANAIINFTVRIQKANPKLGFEISAGLMGLQRVDPSLRRLINSNHEVYRKKNNRGVFNMPSLYPVVVGLIILVRVLSSIDFSGDKANRSTSTFKVEDYQSAMADLSYEGIRLFYQQQYRDSKSSKLPVDFDVNKAIFSDRPIYLLVEAGPLDSLYPMALVNNTGERIKVDVISAGNVSNVAVGEHDILAIRAYQSRSIDMMLTFHQADVSKVIVPATKDLQYLHVAADARQPYHKLNLVDGQSIDLPSVQRDKLKNMPLVVTIDQRNSGYVLSLKGKVQAVNYRALPFVKN
ncbi:hypothetical protein [Taibaiella koreensis]|uniref:hypothetical protein n=1 Tax=Taibaiella koreensis TaxID=1268548 RepID=UPI000E59B647|nr:hypothetical protein [Taibaiella koreensis]